MIQLSNILNEDLRKWFGKGGAGSSTGGGWDRYNSQGKKVGKCGDSKDGSAYAACLSKEKIQLEFGLISLQVEVAPFK